MSLVLVQAIGLGFGAIAVAIVAIFVVSVILSAIKVVKEYERGVISAQKNRMEVESVHRLD